jgi:hypothetical protein
MSVTGEFERYLSALVEALADQQLEASEQLRNRLETACARPHAELVGAARETLGALESWSCDAKSAEATEPGAGGLDERCRDLTAICRIILGQ